MDSPGTGRSVWCFLVFVKNYYYYYYYYIMIPYLSLDNVRAIPGRIF